MAAAAVGRVCVKQGRTPAGLALNLRHRPWATAHPPAARAGTAARWVQASAAGEQAEYLILDYDYTHQDAELLAKRAPFMEDHMQRCRQKAAEGKLLLWGSVGTPITSGMLIWRNAGEAEVAEFVKQDPFVTNGLVRHWTVRPFHVHAVSNDE